MAKDGATGGPAAAAVPAGFLPPRPPPPAVRRRGGWRVPAALAALALALAAWALLSGGSEGGGRPVVWGWYVVNPFTPQGRGNLLFMLSGFWTTVQLSLTAMAISVSLGLAVTLPAITDDPWGRRFNRLYVEAVRSVPILVLILWVYYGLPVVADIRLDVFWAGVLALALSDSAFEAEIFRAGIQGVPKGQTEAARTLGLTWGRTMRLVVLPQALRRILPALANQFVYMLKMSALVSVIGAQELTRRANELVVSEYRPLEIYTVLVLEYLALILVFSQGARWLERRMARSDR